MCEQGQLSDPFKSSYISTRGKKDGWYYFHTRDLATVVILPQHCQLLFSLYVYLCHSYSPHLPLLYSFSTNIKMGIYVAGPYHWGCKPMKGKPMNDVELMLFHFFANDVAALNIFFEKWRDN